MEPLNLDEFESVARATLPRMTYDFIAGGAEDERSLGTNRAAFASRALRNRVLANVAVRDTTSSLLGLELPHPIILAPTALHRVAHPEGELATARGAAAADALYTVSTATSTRLEEIADAAPAGRRWFQLYHLGAREASEQLIAHAIAIGRPQIYGLAAGGANGVRRVVELLRAELDLSMALVGAPSLAELVPDLVV